MGATPIPVEHKNIVMVKFCIGAFFLLLTLHLPAQKKRNIVPVQTRKSLNFPHGADFRQAAAGCDTVNYPVPNAWTPLYYVAATGGVDGFVTGNNAYGDREKAACFNVSSSPDTYLTKVWIAFAIANTNRVANMSKTVPVKVYDGTSGSPGSLLATVNKTLSDLHGDQVNNRYSEIVFPSAVTLPPAKKFFVSVDVTNLTWSVADGYDSLAIYSNAANQSAAGTDGFGWEKNNAAAWGTFTDGWGVDLSLLVHPFISTNPSCALTPPSTVFLSGRIFLQGPYNTATGTMSNALNTQGILETAARAQPYNSTGFDYPGTENVPAGFFAAHTDIVDWVLLELRDPTNPSTIVARRAAFVKQDGSLAETDGISGLIAFAAVPPGNYYATVRHRNHLGVRSAVALDFTNGTAAYDFTASVSKAYAGSVANAPMATLSPGAYGLWGGNANDDAQVKMTGFAANNNDYLKLLNTLGSSINSLSNVYSKQDLNMDGRVNMTGFSATNNDYLKLLNILGSSINSITQPSF